MLHHLAQHLIVDIDLAVNIEFVRLQEAVLLGISFPDLRQEILEVKIPQQIFGTILQLIFCLISL